MQGGYRIIAEQLLENESISLLRTDAYQKYVKQAPSVILLELSTERLDIIIEHVRRVFEIYP